MYQKFDWIWFNCVFYLRTQSSTSYMSSLIILSQFFELFFRIIFKISNLLLRAKDAKIFQIFKQNSNQNSTTY